MEFISSSMHLRTVQLMAEPGARRVTKEEEKWMTVIPVDLTKIADETR